MRQKKEWVKRGGGGNGGEIMRRTKEVEREGHLCKQEEREVGERRRGRKRRK